MPHREMQQGPQDKSQPIAIKNPSQARDSRKMQLLSFAKPSISLDHSGLGRVWWAARIMQAILVVAIVFTGLTGVIADEWQKYDLLSQSAESAIYGLLEAISAKQSILVAAMTAILPALDAMARKADPWKWKSIQCCMDEFREHVFSGRSHSNDFEYKHRVTIFRLQNGSWRMAKPPWQRWFIPIARSGTVTKKTRSIFRFSDNPNRLEGVVGEAWCLKRGNWHFRQDIPLLTNDMPQDEVLEYEGKTNLPIDRAIRMNYCARSYAAIRMEVNGKGWGVLVLDSANEKMPDRRKVDTAFNFLMSAISPILESL